MPHLETMSMAAKAWRYVYPKWAAGLPQTALKTLPKEFCPRMSNANGRWMPAEMSSMEIAKLRKKVLLSGAEWPWEKPGRRGLTKMEREPKGKKRIAKKIAKQELIQQRMADMPKKLEDARLARLARKDAKRSDIWSMLLREIK